jgi:hypothetical protein
MQRRWILLAGLLVCGFSGMCLGVVQEEVQGWLEKLKGIAAGCPIKVKNLSMDQVLSPIKAYHNGIPAGKNSVDLRKIDQDLLCLRSCPQMTKDFFAGLLAEIEQLQIDRVNLDVLWIYSYKLLCLLRFRFSQGEIPIRLEGTHPDRLARLVRLISLSGDIWDD